MNNYKQCLKKYNYDVTDNIYKQTDNNIVLDVIKNNNNNNESSSKTYVAKIALNKSSQIDTEIAALKYFSQQSYSLFFPKFIDNFVCDNLNCFIMEKVVGLNLYSMANDNLKSDFWIDLLSQLILVVYFFESDRILHNDFWDANIMIVPNDKPITINFKSKKYIIKSPFVIKILDFEYTNQYLKNTNIYSQTIMKVSDTDNEKKRLGWSSQFHTGGDLNQILGILSDYKSVHNNIKKTIQKLVVKNEEADFPYAIQTENKKTDAKYLLDNFSKIFNIKSQIITMYEKTIQNKQPTPWLDWIEKGIKKYEGRLIRGDWKNMHIGDKILFYDHNNKKVLVVITDLKYYSNFGDAFNDLGNELIPVQNMTMNDVIKLYSNYYSDSDIKESGVVAIGVNVVTAENVKLV